MNELIEIKTNEQGQQLVDARAVHTFLDIKKPFSDWWKDQYNSLDLLENEDWCILSPLGEKIGRPALEVALTLIAATHICMASRTAKGKELRNYFIEIEKRYKEQIVKQPKLSVIDLLELATSELKQKDIVIQEKNKQIETMKPDHEFVNKVFKTADTNIKIGSFAQAAKIPNPKKPKEFLGEKQMFELLRQMKILKSDNLPMTEYQKQGYFDVIQRTVEVKGNVTRLFTTTFVTPKGQAWLHEKITKYLQNTNEVA